MLVSTIYQQIRQKLANLKLPKSVVPFDVFFRYIELKKGIYDLVKPEMAKF